jgi:hypothetical protein
MGIELPKELADVAAATGLSWPQADEDKMRGQASAWREAQGKLTSLATEADQTANAAVGSLTGPSADAAGKMWSGFVHPDHGHLTTAARGAGNAADQLDHAADQVGASKVAMVRQLVDAAKNRDAAHTAAAAGHPTALLGLDTVLRGTATNLSSLTHGLAGAVGGGAPVPALTDVVDPNPGTHTPHGQNGLVSTVTGLPSQLLPTVDRALGPDVVDRAPLDRVPGVVGSTPGGVHDVAGSALDPVPDAPPVDRLPAGVPVDLVGRPPADVVAQPPVPSTPNPSIVDPGPPPIPGADSGTGPIRLPAPAQYGGFLAASGFDDVPTPPAGIPAPHVPGGTVASGFADGAYSPPPAAPAGPAPMIAPSPVAAPPPGFAPPPSFSGAPSFGSAPPFSGAPPVGGPVVPPPGVPPVSGLPPRQAVPLSGPPGVPARQAAIPYASPPYAAPRIEPAAPAALGSLRQERESVVALFLVHMFPIGHLPMAANRPARQLPVPPAEVDYAPGLRFPPHDHPRSELIDSSDALEKVRGGYGRLPTPAAEPPAALTEGHDPLGALNERDWDRRFLAGMRDAIPEYAWPPGELYPEGGCEDGEPELVPEGAILDRFGGIGGRVFAPEGTLFGKRSLPPLALESGYRRYQVLMEVPMWRAVSAGWFGQPGGGIRYRAVYSADELVTMGYLADVTFEEAE